MTIQFSVASRTAQAQAHETTIGPGAVLRIRTGSPPATCAAARTGTVLASMTLPSDWATASSGSLTRLGTWEDLTADASGPAGYYEITDSAGTCHEQGTVTASGGGGDMEMQQATADIVAGQRVYIGTYNRTWPGA
jgi:hypothetical protein